MKLQISWLRRAAAFCLIGLIAPAFADDSLPYNSWTVSWAPSTMNDDGTPLTDLMGYYIYTGDSPNSLIPTNFTNVDTRGIVLVFPAGETHFFAITAVNVDGVESAMSPLMMTPYAPE